MNLGVVVMVALVVPCLAGCGAADEAQPRAGTGEEAAIGEAASAEADPACVERCERAWEERNAECRKIGSPSLRRVCWAASNAALGLCLKLCPDVEPPD
jgi:hypothetical protein